MAGGAMADLQIAPRSTPRRWYHWLVPRFSLRTLLIVVTLLTVAFGSRIERSERQRRATIVLSKYGHRWEFDEPAQARFTSAKTDEHFKHYYRSITTIDLHQLYPDKTEEVLAAVSGMPQLKKLAINPLPQDADLAPLAHASVLEELVVQYDALHLDAIEHISAISSLRQVRLSRPWGYPGRLRVPVFSPLAKARQLQTVYLFDSDGNPRDLAPIVTLPQLTRFQVNFADDQTCRELAKATQLKALSLHECDITDEGMAHLRSLVNLEELDLGGTLVTDRSVDFIRSFPKLRHLSIDRTRISSSGVALLAQSISRLVFHSSMRSYPNQPKEGFFAHPRSALLPYPAAMILGEPIPIVFESIEHAPSHMPLSFYQGLGTQTSLKSLDLTLVEGTDEALAGLRGLPALSGLNLGHTNVTIKGLQQLTQLPALVLLELPELEDWENAIPVLGDLPKLHTLMIDNRSFTGAEFDVLLGRPIPPSTLKLSYAYGPITSHALRVLEEATHLEELSLEGTTVTDDDLEFLSGFGQLRALNLRNTDVTDKIVPLLACLTSLESIDLTGTAVTAVGLQELAAQQQLKRCLHGNPHFDEWPGQRLSGYESNIPPGEATALSAVDVMLDHAAAAQIKRYEKLRSFSLRDSKVEPSAIDEIASLPRLRSAGFANCNLSIAEQRRLRATYWYIRWRFTGCRSRNW